MTLALTLVFLIAGLVAVTQVVDLRQQVEIKSMMDGVLTRRGQNTLEEIELLAREHRHYLKRYHEWALGSRREGHYAEAVRRLELGCRAIEALAPDFLTALRTLRRLARTVSVIVAVEPVRVYAFRTWRLRGLAGVGIFLHYLLVTGRQHVLLRLHLVSSAFRLALRWLRDSTGRVARQPAGVSEWKRIDALVSDLGTAGDEAVVAARQIVQALDAAELGSPVVRRVGP